MLSRTANNLYWLSRYMERAENFARILEVADRMSMMPGAAADAQHSEWWSTLMTSGCAEAFEEAGLRVEGPMVTEFLARNPENPSSIYSSIRQARENGRAVRTSLTMEMWECLNDTWLSFDQRWTDARRYGELRSFLDWVKERSTVFRGGLYGTMLRDDAFDFARLGTYVERADNTARILDVKYHVLLPEGEEVGGGVDYFQWTSLLRAFSALGSYHYLYRENPKPWKIAELMILRREMPRSLIGCYQQTVSHLDRLAEAYGSRHECHRIAGQVYSQLQFADANDIFQSGLHEFLSDFIVRNNRLGNEVARSYMFIG
jgi:uncharacterized alpha-E superfamily protein